MIKALIGKVNTRSLIITTIVVFVFIFVSDFIIHGVILKPIYQATASLWRPEAAMKSYFIWMLLGQFIVAKFFTIIFVKGYTGKGVIEGIRFGFLAWGFMVGHFLINYSVAPMPGKLICAWIIGVLAQTMGAGVLAAVTYKK